jgi:L-aminopeptidase/D-esterase-like protein
MGPVQGIAGEASGADPLAGSKLDSAPLRNTTIAVVATDARLTRNEAQRLAMMAADGMARAIRPIHTPLDGDTVFALSTGVKHLGDVPAWTLTALGSLAADTLARAIGRAMWEAESIGRWRCYRALRI